MKCKTAWHLYATALSFFLSFFFLKKDRSLLTLQVFAYRILGFANCPLPSAMRLRARQFSNDTHKLRLFQVPTENKSSRDLCACNAIQQLYTCTSTRRQCIYPSIHVVGDWRGRQRRSIMSSWPEMSLSLKICNLSIYLAGILEYWKGSGLVWLHQTLNWQRSNAISRWSRC